MSKREIDWPSIFPGGLPEEYAEPGFQEWLTANPDAIVDTERDVKAARKEWQAQNLEREWKESGPRADRAS